VGLRWALLVVPVLATLGALTQRPSSPQTPADDAPGARSLVT